MAAPTAEPSCRAESASTSLSGSWMSLCQAVPGLSDHSQLIDLTSLPSLPPLSAVSSLVSSPVSWLHVLLLLSRLPG